MSKLTLDEAIKHCLEVAEQNDFEAETYELLAENNHNAYERLTAETNSSRCAECAADHRQLAEWLRELKELKIKNKELKRYLKEAIAGFCKLGKALNDEGDCDSNCENCALNNGGNCYKWRLESEVLVLIGKDGDTNG